MPTADEAAPRDPMPPDTTIERTANRSTDSPGQNTPAESELAEVLVLQSISAELIHEQSAEALYEKIVDAAVLIMRSDYASMQMLFPERGPGGELRLLAFRGFNPEAARFWEWVRADSKSTCGLALRTGQRVVAPHIANCSLMAGSEDQQVYLATGIHACQTTPLIGRGGNVVGMISTHWRAPHQPSERDFRLFDILARQAADLIERTRREQELAERAALLDLSTDAIIVRDLEGRILYWSRGAQRLYGWTRNEALGQNIHALLQTQFPEPLEQINRELATRQYWQGELIHTARDGRRVVVLCRKVLDGTSHSTGSVLETNTDITERRRVEEQARAQEERLRKTEKIAAAGQLAASLAHEINNPLMSVTNALYLLNHTPDLNPDDKNLLRTAASELARVSRIVQQSLSYYRAGTVAQEVDLSALVEESLAIFSDRFRRAGVQLSKKILPAALITCVPGEVRQAVDNLLLNALEATPAEGRVAISVRPSRNWSDHNHQGVRLTIGDTGCGIPREHLSRIFEPFFSTKQERGTGLGLWVVRGIVLKHGGAISVRSFAAEGRTGTVVSVLWPCSGQNRTAA
ncbi:MAG TPA: ATP-binding protein [Terriglobales bacterium]|nr:ATP-binding protein [Terriglobales bacterium]